MWVKNEKIRFCRPNKKARDTTYVMTTPPMSLLPNKLYPGAFSITCYTHMRERDNPIQSTSWVNLVESKSLRSRNSAVVRYFDVICCVWTRATSVEVSLETWEILLFFPLKPSPNITCEWYPLTTVNFDESTPTKECFQKFFLCVQIVTPTLHSHWTCKIPEIEYHLCSCQLIK